MAAFTIQQLKEIKIFGTPVTHKKVSAFDILNSYDNYFGYHLPALPGNASYYMLIGVDELGSTVSDWATLDSLLGAFDDYADDAAAATGGVAVGGVYWDTDGTLHKRLS